ncbi:MAG: PRC-barrel domain containing protein, partial [Rhodospirillales bacterium]|nr:PRC-barrel domain containing protein [Rhodospirillales bacterium]
YLLPGAQSPNPTAQTRTSTSAPAPVRMLPSPGDASFYITKLADGWTSVGAFQRQDIYNRAGERIGSVKDLLVGPDGKVSAAVIGVGSSSAWARRISRCRSKPCSAAANGGPLIMDGRERSAAHRARVRSRFRALDQRCVMGEPTSVPARAFATALRCCCAQRRFQPVRRCARSSVHGPATRSALHRWSRCTGTGHISLRRSPGCPWSPQERSRPGSRGLACSCFTSGRCKPCQVADLCCRAASA